MTRMTRLILVLFAFFFSGYGEVAAELGGLFVIEGDIWMGWGEGWEIKAARPLISTATAQSGGVTVLSADVGTYRNTYFVAADGVLTGPFATATGTASNEANGVEAHGSTRYFYCVRLDGTYYAQIYIFSGAAWSLQSSISMPTTTYSVALFAPYSGGSVLLGASSTSFIEGYSGGYTSVWPRVGGTKYCLLADSSATYFLGARKYGDTYPYFVVRKVSGAWTPAYSSPSTEWVWLFDADYAPSTFYPGGYNRGGKTNVMPAQIYAGKAYVLSSGLKASVRYVELTRINGATISRTDLTATIPDTAIEPRFAVDSAGVHLSWLDNSTGHVIFHALTIGGAVQNITLNDTVAASGGCTPPYAEVITHIQPSMLDYHDQGFSGKKRIFRAGDYLFSYDGTNMMAFQPASMGAYVDWGVLLTE